MHNHKLFMTAKSKIVRCHSIIVCCTQNRSFGFCGLKSTAAIAMDKFVSVTKKSKTDENVPQNPYSDDIAQSSTSNKSEKSKHKPARKFQPEWENDFFATENNGKTFCLICQTEFTENRKYVIERHFNSQHSAKNSKFANPKERAEEILRLKESLQKGKKIVRDFLDKNELLTCASYEIAFNIAKAAKPYVDGEFHKNLLLSTVKTLCEHVDENLKANLLDKIQLLPISDTTISRRVNDLGANIENTLKNDLCNCHSFSLALDETTDIGDTSQLVFWVRYVDDTGNVKENLLALVPLEEQTRAIDIFEGFLSVIARFDLDLSKLVCVCTDGAPAMIGKHSGFIARLKKYMDENDIKHQLTSYHCILHQENLCAKSIEGGCGVLKTITEVCK